jgi:uncharacterized protein
MVVQPVVRQVRWTLCVFVRVLPRANHSQICGVEEGELVVRLAAPPVDGEANAELVRVLAQTLNLRPSQLTLVKGDKSRSKCIAIEANITTKQIERIFAEIVKE